MGSGILLAVLVVLWIVVLVPMVLNRGHTAESATNQEGGSAMRVLRRRGAVESAEEAAPSSGRSGRDWRAEADVLARRRRTLLGLIGLAAAWMLAAIFYRSYFWTAQIVLDLMVFAYIVYLRLEAQRDQERRERRAARFSERPTPSRPPVRGASRPQVRRPVSAEVAAPVEPVSATPGPVQPEGWTPNPVPVPTYVNQPAAPRRRYAPEDLAVVALDDDDPGLAEIAEWTPKRAVGD